MMTWCYMGVLNKEGREDDPDLINVVLDECGDYNEFGSEL